ncbi:MAG: FAD-binding oxidoreductase [Propionicimonas sp.]|uniref:FAD-binding oxidoreductase n=1 Tax=Propionicimonas sp. TaxID=1955623 RepID=UPI002B2212D4|nr:FAD-binding oxidoreductase [Propionicimonas sp.]MEA4944888.1 FAD-binding oxidoreductase [Propionicimonas sp.]
MADKSLNRDTSTLDPTPWGHRWGYRDTKLFVHPDQSVEMTGERYNLCGYRMPYLIPFINNELNVTIDFSSARPETARPKLTPVNRNEAFLAALAGVLRTDQFTTDDPERLLHSHGQTTTEEVSRVLFDNLDRTVDLVVWPEGDEDCQALVTLAGEHGVCLIPYGGGTNVSSALLIPAGEDRMVVSVDTKRMNAILSIDRANLTATVQAGVQGSRLEELLAKEGLTCGHEPDSVELSTLGGWIATNASGMKKNRYGNIEDLVENITLVTPSGVIEQRYSSPRQSPGIQLQKALFGSEGNLGLITKAVIHVHPLPEVKKYGSVIFSDWQTGVAFMEALNRTGVKPASIRLVDNLQFRLGQSLKAAPTGSKVLMGKVEQIFVTKIKGFDHHTMVAATIVYEGSAEEVALQEKVVAATAKQFGGVQGGSGNGERGYMLTYAIAYIRDFLADYYIIGETYETTVPWDRIHDVCDAVERVANSEHQRLGFPGRPFTSPRVTQMYHSGVCIYFTHGLYHRGTENGEEKFAEMERTIRAAIMDAGGSISHHHGVGKLRKPFVDRVASPETVEAVKALKQAVDPKNVFGVGNNVFAR